jgi:alpha-N-arabinofuranosidase
MFASHVGTEILGSSLQGAGDRLFYSVTRDAAKGVIYLKLVNASSAAQPMKIALAGAKSIRPTAKSILLHGATTAATNSISDPKRVVPVESTVTSVAKEFTRTLPGYSVEVLEISAQ